MRELQSLISVYSFDVIDAMLYGVDEAILLHNIKYWVLTNKANNKNYFDGRTWTYNSAKAFSEIFPFWNVKKIPRLLESLEKKGAIVSGNYNKAKYDRTKWYALSQEPSDFSEMRNGFLKNEQPIPDINTYINTNIISEGQGCPSQERIAMPPASKGKKSDFLPPTPEEVKKYIEEKKYNIDPVYFFEYYSADGWRDKNNKPIKNWKLKAFTWHKNNSKVSNPITETKTEPTIFDENFEVITREDYIHKMNEWRKSGRRNDK